MELDQMIKQNKFACDWYGCCRHTPAPNDGVSPHRWRQWRPVADIATIYYSADRLIDGNVCKIRLQFDAQLRQNSGERRRQSKFFVSLKNAKLKLACEELWAHTMNFQVFHFVGSLLARCRYAESIHKIDGIINSRHIHLEYLIICMW